jgi:hypothetical protein
MPVTLKVGLLRGDWLGEISFTTSFRALSRYWPCDLVSIRFGGGTLANLHRQLSLSLLYLDGLQTPK